jgi:ribosomal protein L37AE/L43A
MSKPACPGCASTSVEQHDGDFYFCVKCQNLFDANPGEGGDYYTDPTKRLEKQEEYEERQRQRRQDQRARLMRPR